MKANIKTLFNNNGQLMGAVVSSIIAVPIDERLKNFIEEQLIQYCRDVLFIREGISCYSVLYDNMASVFAIKNMNDLPEYELEI